MKKEFLAYIETLDEKEIGRLEELVYMSKAEKERREKQKRENKKNKKGKRNKRKRKSGSEYKLLLWGVIGIATLIICAMLVMNFMICFPGDSSIDASNPKQEEFTNEEKAESTLLATGLSMIGLAISVWAGLNIVQVLEKGKLDALGREVEVYKQERCELNKRNFFNNILQMEDTLNRHLYKMFSRMESESDNLTVLYFECNKIELKFQNVYGKQKQIKRNIPTEYYKDAIEDTERLLAEVSNGDYENADIFIKYLKVRLAEFYFYLGYNVGADESISCFQNVIDYFYEVFEELKDPKMIMEKRYYLDGDKPLTLYMFNTLGEAYSKILQAHLVRKENIEDFHEISNKLEAFYEYVIELIEGRQTNNKDGYEVYYRNYGCALERINKYKCNGKECFEDVDLFRKIKELYQKALDDVLFGNKENLREQTFQVYVSLYYKYIKSIDIMECLKSNITKLDMLQGNLKDFEQYTQDVELYVNLAMNITPLNLYFWKIKAFVERDYTVWALAKGDKKNAKKHYDEFKEWWKRIEQAEERRGSKENDKLDDMYKELEEASKVLGKYFD